jgi:hypothetical protein
MRTKELFEIYDVVNDMEKISLTIMDVMYNINMINHFMKCILHGLCHDWLLH